MECNIFRGEVELEEYCIYSVCLFRVSIPCVYSVCLFRVSIASIPCVYSVCLFRVSIPCVYSVCLFRVSIAPQRVEQLEEQE